MAPCVLGGGAVGKRSPGYSEHRIHTKVRKLLSNSSSANEREMSSTRLSDWPDRRADGLVSPPLGRSARVGCWPAEEPLLAGLGSRNESLILVNTHPREGDRGKDLPFLRVGPLPSRAPGRTQSRLTPSRQGAGAPARLPVSSGGTWCARPRIAAQSDSRLVLPTLRETYSHPLSPFSWRHAGRLLGEVGRDLPQEDTLTDT